ncbi:MAG TPA: pantetheine-phosphate adenylyltransferase [Patescibacteria group bacterium]
MKYPIALIVGRFQPFHKGHLFLIKKALEKSDKIIIGIGSANISDENNPIDFETRKKVIKAVFYKEGIEEKLIKIVPLDDFFNDKKWLSNLKKQVGKFNLALGNNDWTNNILENAGYKVLKVDYYKRSLYEGWRIRKLIKEGKSWQNRVPKYIVSWLHGFVVKNNNGATEQFNHVVIGGTFDHFHAGHKALLEESFKVGKKITIGIAMEELYKNKFLSEIIETFEIRKKSVSEFLKKKGWFKRAKLISFSHFTGGADKSKNIDAIIVSKETYPNAFRINQLREKNKLPLLEIITINDVLAEDGKLISSDRIRAGEIDKNGKNYKLQITNNKKELIMPESLREELRKPLGKIYKSVGAILESPKKPLMVIAIGDIIVDSLLKSGIDPDVKIIDFRSRRMTIKKDTLLKDSLYKDCLYQKQFLNNPGTINLKTSEIIKEKIKLALYKKQKSWIVIDGEEDLLALPAILFAPLDSLVLYGHWQLGIIVVEVDEKIKVKVKKIIKKFN